MSVLTGKQFKNACSYIVYVWSRKGDILYVGSSTKGILRFGSHQVLTLSEILDDDLIEIIPCQSDANRRKLEKHLICKFNPKFNKNVLSAPERKAKSPTNIPLDVDDKFPEFNKVN